MLAHFKAFFRKNEKAALPEDKAAQNCFNRWFRLADPALVSASIPKNDHV